MSKAAPFWKVRLINTCDFVGNAMQEAGSIPLYLAPDWMAGTTVITLHQECHFSFFASLV